MYFGQTFFSSMRLCHCHGPGLLLLGDGDEGGAGNRSVAPAVVPDFLRKLVEAQYLAEGASGLADDGGCQVSCFVDDNPALPGKQVNDIPVMNLIQQNGLMGR
jgi:hypothetical protein